MTGAARVVSLVPSVTETLLALGLVPVACTRFCEQPGISTVGGTKDPDVAGILALAPDLVVVNDEENRREDADALAAAGLRLHSMSPRAVDDVPAAIGALAAACGVTVPEDLARWRPPPAPAPTGTQATLVWRRPWMVAGADTYGSSVLAHLGLANAFADAGARYPEVTLDAVAARAPAVVVLPSEPYPFGARHVSEVRDALVAATRVVLVDGRDLFWWGARTPVALARLEGALAAG